MTGFCGCWHITHAPALLAPPGTPETDLDTLTLDESGEESQGSEAGSEPARHKLARRGSEGSQDLSCSKLSGQEGQRGAARQGQQGQAVPAEQEPGADMHEQQWQPPQLLELEGPSSCGLPPLMCYGQSFAPGPYLGSLPPHAPASYAPEGPTPERLQQLLLNLKSAQEQQHQQQAAFQSHLHSLAASELAGFAPYAAGRSRGKLWLVVLSGWEEV